MNIKAIKCIWGSFKGSHLSVLVLFFFVVLEALFASLSIVGILPVVSAILDGKYPETGVKIFDQFMIDVLGDQVLNSLLLLAGLLTLKVTLGVVRSVYAIAIGEKMRVRWVASVADVVLHEPLRLFLSREDGEIATDVMDLPRGAQNFFVGLAGYLALCVQGGLIVAAMALVNMQVLLVSVALAVVGLLLLRKPYHIRAKHLGQSNIVVIRETYSYLLGILRAIREVKILGLYPEAVASLRWRLQKMREIEFKTRVYQIIPNFAAEIIFVFLIVGIYLYAVEASSREISQYLPQVAFFVVGAQKLISISASFATQNFKIINNFQRLDEMQKIIASKQVEDEKKGKDADFSGEITVECKNLSLVFSGVAVWDSVNLHLPFNGLNFFVGPSGSGKSSFMDILTRLQQPSSGSIHVGGGDIESTSLKSWRRLFGYVSQEPTLLSGSLFDNIAAFDPDVSEESVYRAAELANLAEFVACLPNGYQTQVGKSGATLSGGQRRRVALARALVRLPKVIILDEALTAVEEDAEREILLRLRDEVGVAIFIITHRTSNIDLANRVYEFSNRSIYLTSN